MTNEKERRFAAIAARVTVGDNAADALRASLKKLPEGGVGHFFAPAKAAVEDKTDPKHLGNLALWLLQGRPSDIKAPYTAKTLTVAETVVRDALPNCRRAANGKGETGVLVCPENVPVSKTLGAVATRLAKESWVSVETGLRLVLSRATKELAGDAFAMTKPDRKSLVLLVEDAADREKLAAALAPTGKAATQVAAVEAVWDSGKGKAPAKGSRTRKTAAAGTEPAVTIRDGAGWTKAKLAAAVVKLKAMGSATVDTITVKGTDAASKAKQDLIDVVLATAFSGPPLSSGYALSVNRGNGSNIRRLKAIEALRARVKAERPQLLEADCPCVAPDVNLSLLLANDGKQDYVIFAFNKDAKLRPYDGQHLDSLKAAIKGVNPKREAFFGYPMNEAFALTLAFNKDTTTKVSPAWWSSVIATLLKGGLAFGGAEVKGDRLRIACFLHKAS